MRRFLVGPTVVCLAATLLLAGCGDDDDGGGGGGSGQAVSPADYADNLCDLLIDFADKAEKSVKDAGLEEALSGAGGLKSVDDLPKLIGGLKTMFSDLEGFFVDLGGELGDLGVPDVKGGEAFAEKLNTAIDKGGKLIGDASKALGETNPDSLADLNALGPVFEDFGKAFEEVDIDPATDAPKALADAYEKSKRCQELEDK